MASGSEPARESEQIIAALRQENAALREENKALRTTIAQLQERIRELERHLGQNSRNSSRPPSSDPPWTPPAPAQRRSGRRPGGQRGHPGHHCALVPREQVDRVVDHWPKACPHCQGTLTPECEVGTPVPHQAHEVEYAHRVIQHDRHRVRCAHCGTTVLAELPPEVAGSQYGPGLAALVTVPLAAGVAPETRVRFFRRGPLGCGVDTTTREPGGPPCRNGCCPRRRVRSPGWPRAAVGPDGATPGPAVCRLGSRSRRSRQEKHRRTYNLVLGVAAPPVAVWWPVCDPAGRG